MDHGHQRLARPLLTPRGRLDSLLGQCNLVNVQSLYSCRAEVTITYTTSTRLVHGLHAGHMVTPVEKSIARLAFASADAHRVVSDCGRPDLYPN
jgi:hypothetical protein